MSNEFRTIQSRYGELKCVMSDKDAAEYFAKHAAANHRNWYFIHSFVNEHSSAKTMSNGFLILDRMIWLAKHNGLKQPKIRICFEDLKWIIYRPKSGSGNLCFKNGNLIPGTFDPIGDARYRGLVFKDSGKWLSGKDYTTGRKVVLSEKEERFLELLNDAPREFIANCGKGCGMCSYCGKRLEDDRSKAVGYGKICAGRYGLPWGKDESDWLKEGFADPDVPDGFPPPRNKMDWLIIADYLYEYGDTEGFKRIHDRVANLDWSV